MDKTVYLDNNATSRVAPEVVDVMTPFFGELYGNPSSMHAFGGQVAKYVSRAREEVAAFFNCQPDEVVFTSCATESDNTAIRGTAEFFGKDLKIVTTAVEHPAVLQPCRRLKALGHEVVELPVDGVGQIDLARLENELKNAKGPVLVSAMWANNETGTVSPVAEIAKICKARGAIFHTDAVQAAGKTKIDLSEVKADMLSISGHKFHAPKGGFEYSKLTFSVLGSLCALSPLTRVSGHLARIASSSLSRMRPSLSFSASMPSRASSHAFASPIMYGTFSVPARRPPSWCPPSMKGLTFVPLRT